ncbi:MAG TPA: amidohydrolase family protein [Gemmatimonadales bacterium]|jgi:5-methylthioadenosine/S-adenosylhomocysteine deaminase
MRRLRLRARWLVPVSGEPIRDGAVLVGEDGRIADVGPDSIVPLPQGAESEDLGEAALLPGLVNTHTHLELTALRGLVTDTVFPRWIGRIRKIKDAMISDHFRAGARWGVLEHFAHGITSIGDTGSTGAAAFAMADLGARGVAYQEVFGPDPAQLDDSLRGLREALHALDLAAASDRVRVGVSPHAPYTVSRQLAGAVASLARIQKRPLAMHMAESQDEWLFIAEGRGAFAEHLRGRGISVDRHRVSPLIWALRAGLDTAEPLLIHCVHVDRGDCEAIAGCGGAVAHCPWSNQLLGVGRANLAQLADARVTVAVGTDSVVAGNSLDLFEESRLASLGSSLTPRERLGMFTSAGAAALGAQDCGRIAVGAWADLCALSLDAPVFARTRNIEGAITAASKARDVTHTWVGGRNVYRRGTWPGVDAAAERGAAERAEAAMRVLAA